MKIGSQVHIVELKVTPERGWEELFWIEEGRDEAERVWTGVLATGITAPARLLEAEIVRSFSGRGATPADVAIGPDGRL